MMICPASPGTQPDVAAPAPSLRLEVVGSPAPDVVAPAPRTEPHSEKANVAPQSDFPPPQVIANVVEIEWDEDQPYAENAATLGRGLENCGDLYRHSSYAGGLMLASSAPNILPEPIIKGKRLASIIADRVRVRIKKDGEEKGHAIPASLLEVLLASEVFLQQFRAIDQVVTTPLYLPNFELTLPGYTDRGRGFRILYVGEPPRIKRGTDVIQRFLDTMPFTSTADRTNAVAAAITVMFRNLFLGGKPLINVTANKSHAGKDTVILFAAGQNRVTSISYQGTDWALERSFVGAVKHSPDTAVIKVENARLGSGEGFIASAFLERFLCDPEPTLFSTGSGGPVRRANDLVVAMSTNFGSLSTDLLNRDLPIDLNLVGNVVDRKSPIGNPKVEYLPRHAEEIAAELRGMVECWKEAGGPLDSNVRHPFSQWAAVVGGILWVNGFQDFLANYSMRRTVEDPLRDGLAMLGAASKNDWKTPGEWAELAVSLGLAKRVIPRGDQDNDTGRARGMGIVLTAHDQETFHAETDTERVVLRLEKARRRFEGGEVSTRYRFIMLDHEPLPEDSDVDPEGQSTNV